MFLARPKIPYWGSYKARHFVVYKTGLLRAYKGLDAPYLGAPMTSHKATYFKNLVKKFRENCLKLGEGCAIYTYKATHPSIRSSKGLPIRSHRSKSAWPYRAPCIKLDYLALRVQNSITLRYSPGQKSCCQDLQPCFGPFDP